jgi:hypothetical protein
MSTSSQTAGARLRMSSPGVVFRDSETGATRRFIVDNGKPLKMGLPPSREVQKSQTSSASKR